MHGEIKNGVVVVPERTRRRQLFGELLYPRNMARVTIIRVAGHSAKPPGNIAVDQYGPLTPMERKPGCNRVHTDAFKAFELVDGLGQHTIPIDSDAGDFLKELDPECQSQCTDQIGEF